jgi:serine/threonine-protein kinase
MNEPAGSGGAGDHAPVAGDAPTVPAQPAEIATGSAPATRDLPAEDRAASAIDAIGPGAAIGRFVVRARLGAGGMGVVLAADDPDLGRQVALKLVKDDAAPGLRARLLREAQAMARLEHPNVVRVFEVGAAGDRLFIAMELIDGETLTRWLAAAPRPWREVVAMFRAIGDGLAAVHGAGLVHRDFKPDNVLIDRDGRARVADFGLARLDAGASTGTASPLRHPLTRTGAMMGTPGFMAPEQQFGGDVDARADQYSFCVALRTALGDEWPRAPRSLRAATTRGLSFDPANRFPSMTPLLAALDRVARPLRVGVVGAVAAGMLVASAVTAAVATSRGDDAPTTGARVPIVAAATPAPDAAATIARELAAPVPVPVPVPAPVGVDAGVPAERARPVRIAADAAPALVHAHGVDAGAPDHAYYPHDKVDPAHLAAVRAAIGGLGYGALDVDSKAARAQVEATRADGGEPFAIAQVELGMALRRDGDCGRARATWMNAIPILKHGGQEALAWSGRAYLGEGLCQLAAGNAAAAQISLESAYSDLEFAVSGTDADEADDALARAIVEWERGDPSQLFAGRHAGDHDARTRALLDAYAAAVGAP